jgi:CheY-like chemotaxis protein
MRSWRELRLPVTVLIRMIPSEGAQMAISEDRAETVLVVDGDVITRIVVSDYLRHCGFRVIEAHDANEAQQALEYKSFNVDIVLCDIDLPGEINGFQLARWTREKKPDIKIVLSGAVEKTASDAGDLCEDGPQLAKPYDPAKVVEHIKRLRGAVARK